MTRVMLVTLTLFLLPFIIFAGWRWLITGTRGKRAIMTDAPILILLFTGLALVASGLFYFASYEKQDIEGQYHPPQYKDGKIEPGYFEKPETQSR